MKIRIEFHAPKEGEDSESRYDVVEITTVHAGSIDEWGLAVEDFVGPANWQRRAILLSALMQNEDDMCPGGYWYRENRKELAALAEEIAQLLRDIEST